MTTLLSASSAAATAVATGSAFAARTAFARRHYKKAIVLSASSPSSSSSPSSLLSSSLCSSPLPIGKRVSMSDIRKRTEGQRLLSTRAEKEDDSASQTAVVAPAATPSPTSATPAPGSGRFSVRSDKLLDVVLASTSFAFRLGSGALISGYKVSVGPVVEDGKYATRLGGFQLNETGEPGTQPAQPIILYEHEGCPFCKKVREAMSILDLEVYYKPSPRGSRIFRPEMKAIGGKELYPFIVDPNTGVTMYESDEIIKYLFSTYGGNRPVPTLLNLGLITNLSCGFALMARLGKGSSYTPAKPAEKPLELWAYEGSPFCKIVREKLSEFELQHILHNTPRGSPRRQELFQLTGKFQVPYLEDPNTGVKMFESAEIIDYLEKTYRL